MKYFLLSTILLIFFISSYSQQVKDEEVKKALQAILHFMEKNDAGAVQNLIADEYQMDGHSELTCIKNKAQRLTGIQSGQIKYGSINLEDKQNHLYILNDTTATVLAQSTVTYKACNSTGPEYAIRTSQTSVLVFVKRKGNWLLSSECVGRNCTR
ncbi:MAG: hypothetical protein B6D37_04665 [Sphingobacteriales bacterium UTBCD1]|jgi:hypothetical protein|nr:MAG: hypothetical protein B6D37_04665 [Sphingobacteriales bacterium UTBCD1]